MLSDEEKEAIKNLRLNVTNVGFSVYDGTTSLFKMRDIQIVLNLIEKQQKETECDNLIIKRAIEIKDKQSKEIEELKENKEEYIKKLEETKNKLVRYIAVKEGKDFEQVCREFEI